MTAASKNMQVEKLDEIVHEYNNTYHNTIRMKPVDVTSGIYIKYDVDHNGKDPKFKVSDHVRISRYKNISANGYTPY